MVKSIKKSDQGHLVFESFTLEYVLNSSAKLFPENTLRSFTHFLTEKLNPEGQREAAISEMLYPSNLQIVTDGKFMFFQRKLSKSSDFFSGTQSLPFFYGCCLGLELSQPRMTESHRKQYRTQKVSKNERNWVLQYN